MKKIPKIILRIVLVLVIFFIVTSIYLYVAGKQMVEKSLTDAIGRKVTIGRLFYDFPFGLRAFHLNIDGLVKSKDIKIQFDINSLSRKELVFSYVSLNAPILTINGDAKAKSVKEPVTEKEAVTEKEQTPQQAVPAKASTVAVSKRVIIGKLLINNGRLIYQNDFLPNDKDLILERVSLTATGVVLPIQKGQIKFDGAAQLEMPENPFNQSRLRLSGWIDWISRSADVDLTLVQSDGENQIKAKVFGENNLLTVNGEMSASNFIFGFLPKGDDKSAEWMKSLPLADLNIGAAFSFETQMDHPKLGNISFAGKVKMKD